MKIQKLLLLSLSICAVFLFVINIVFAILYKFASDELSSDTFYKTKMNWLYTNVVLAIMCLMIIFVYVSLIIINKFKVISA